MTELAVQLQRIRVIDLETAGSAVTSVCEIGWQDVVLRNDSRWDVNEERGALFVNPGRPITPETMAIHHILDRDVGSAPYWKQIAPDVLQPTGGVLALAAHRAASDPISVIKINFVLPEKLPKLLNVRMR